MLNRNCDAVSRFRFCLAAAAVLNDGQTIFAKQPAQTAKPPIQHMTHAADRLVLIPTAAFDSFRQASSQANGLACVAAQIEICIVVA